MTAATGVPQRAASAFPWREAVLLALWLLATIGARPLLLPDEGRYAGVAYEMLQGSALVTTLDGLPFFHKPPLLYWAEMAAMQLFGIDAFAVRVGPVLMAWAMGLGLFLHLRRWHGVGMALAWRRHRAHRLVGAGDEPALLHRRAVRQP